MQERLLWIEFRRRDAILKHYERMGVVGRERIFAEAAMFRAATAIYNYIFQSVG